MVAVDEATEDMGVLAIREEVKDNYVWVKVLEVRAVQVRGITMAVF